MNEKHHLKVIRVQKLFGRYSYELPKQNEELTDLNIVYGENGLGKTTLLNLVFHLLSASNTSAHRAKLSEIPFEFLEVQLKDGTIVSARKDPQLLAGPMTLKLQTPTEEPIVWLYSEAGTTTIRSEDIPDGIDLKKLPSQVRKEVERILDQRRFIAGLGALEITVLMLTSDRILMSDSTREVARELSRASLSAPTGDPQRARAKLAELVLDYRTAAVADALTAASNWMRSRFFDKTYGGAESTGKLYQDVIRKIASTTQSTKTGIKATEVARIRTSLKESIGSLVDNSKLYARYGISVPSISPEILKDVMPSKGNKLVLINNILEPHLRGIEEKYANVHPLFLLLDSFVNSINGFLRDKKCTYSVRNGFKITIGAGTGLKEISPVQLSSGEQQLIMLFCHVLITRDKPSIFIIDEPELSLNILWQRMLVSSLLTISKDASVQFVFASHSMEILSKHRDRVIEMEEG